MGRFVVCRGQYDKPREHGNHPSIEETFMFASEVHSILYNNEAHLRKGCVVTIVKVSRAKEGINVLKKISKVVRPQVEEVRLEFSDSKRKLFAPAFPMTRLP